MEATRQIYWNIQGKETMYLLFLVSFTFFMFGLLRKVRIWKLGRRVSYDQLGERLKSLLVTLLIHPKTVFKGTFRRLMHLSIFYGFIFLAIGSLLIALQEYVHLPVFRGRSYLLISLFTDLLGLAVMIGVSMAAYKRYIDKKDHAEYTVDDAMQLLLIFVIVFTGFILEALRIYVTNDPYGAWSPIGFLPSKLLENLGISVATAKATHGFLWYFHMLLSLSLIAYLPYSKLFHLISVPLNLMFHTSSHIGELTPVARLDLASEKGEKVGVIKLADFSQKQLLELDSCISCLRCVKGCPAHTSGDPLSPRGINNALKNFVKKNSSFFTLQHMAEKTVAGEVVSQDALWACTTCGLCEDKCPVKIEHLRKIVDLRRGLVSLWSRRKESNNKGIKMPSEIERLFVNMSQKQNPWGLSSNGRFDLTWEPALPLISKRQPVEVLFWVGCFGSYESRSQRVTQAVLKILERAGVDYAALGEEEKCCGDSVRRLGNEQLFQSLAVANVNTLNSYRFKTIVTHCPHCYNTLKNEYPAYGGHYQVLHHSEFILELLYSQRIKLGAVDRVTVSYHDPCYLGRYNSVYEAPRELLRAIAGLEVIEMKNNRVRAFCCGGGGGRIWMKDSSQRKLNNILVERALGNGADILLSSCPLCLTRLTEAATGLVPGLKTKDIAEIVAEALA